MALRQDDEKEVKSESEQRQIGVFGASGIASIFQATSPVIPENICEATSTRNFNGTGLQVAEILRALGVPVVFFTTVTTDSLRSLVERKLAGVDVETVLFVIPNKQTPHTVYILTQDGQIALGANVDDMNPELTVDMLAESKHIERFKKLDQLVIDTSFSEDVYTLLLSVLPPSLVVSIIISSLSSAKRINPLLSRCNKLFGHVDQLNLLTGNLDCSDDGIANTLRTLASRGPETVFAYSQQKVYALAHGELYKAKANEVAQIVNTNSQEAFAAAILSCLHKGESIEKAIRFALEVDERVKTGKQVSAILVDDQLNEAKEKQQKKQGFFFNKAPAPTI